MKEWEYTFGPVSKEEWIRQIEKDLRQRPVESTYSEWWQGAPLIPFVHKDDVINEIVCLPDYLFTQPPKIAEWIEADALSPDAVNHQILESLQYGVQSIILKTDVVSKSIIKEYLKGVFLEMVSVSIHLPLSKSNDHQTLQENDGIPVLTRIERNDLSYPFSSIVEQIKQRTDGIKLIRLVYRIPSSGIWDIETTKTFQRVMDDLAIWIGNELPAEAFFNQCTLVLEADQTYFKHILQTSVLHLLWQNLKAHFSATNTDHANQYLECHIIPEATEQPDHFLIRASMSSLAASLCGTHSICIHPSTQPTSQAFYKRINRNIHHLLELESGMYRGTDPLAGAYAIDYHTKQMTNRIWEMLFKKE